MPNERVIPLVMKAFRDCILLLFVFGFLYLAFSGVRPLANPDEGRYVEIPREMIVSGDWVSPRLNGVLYFEKPPLFYWMQAVALKIGGIHEPAARFMPALLGLLGILATYIAGWKLYDRRTGLFSAIVLGSSLIYFALSQIITLDIAVSVFIGCCLWCFLIGIQYPLSRRRRLWFAAFYAFMGLAVLSKGLIGLVFPAVIIFLWTVLLGKWRDLSRYYMGMGLLIFLAITVPWHVMAALRNPEFLWFYFVHEHFLRYLSSTHSRVQPFWFFFAFLPLGLLPWVTFLPQSVWAVFQGGWTVTQRRPAKLLCVIWILFILFFFSLSKSKLIPYILSVYFPLSLMIGRYLARAWIGSAQFSLRWSLYAYTWLILILTLIFPFVLVRRSEDITFQALPWLGALLIVLILSAVLIHCFTRLDRLRYSLVVLMATAACILAFFNPIAGAFKRPSTREIAHSLKPRLQPEDHVFHAYDYFHDFTAYLERTTSLANHRPDEHGFGLQLEDHSDRYLEGQAFVDFWRSPAQAYALVEWHRLSNFKRDVGEDACRLVLTDPHFVIISNH